MVTSRQVPPRLRISHWWSGWSKPTGLYLHAARQYRLHRTITAEDGNGVNMLAPVGCRPVRGIYPCMQVSSGLFRAANSSIRKLLPFAGSKYLRALSEAYNTNKSGLAKSTRLSNRLLLASRKSKPERHSRPEHLTGCRNNPYCRGSCWHSTGWSSWLLLQSKILKTALLLTSV